MRHYIRTYSLLVLGVTIITLSTYGQPICSALFARGEIHIELFRQISEDSVGFLPTDQGPLVLAKIRKLFLETGDLDFRIDINEINREPGLVPAYEPSMGKDMLAVISAGGPFEPFVNFFKWQQQQIELIYQRKVRLSFVNLRAYPKGAEPHDTHQLHRDQGQIMTNFIIGEQGRFVRQENLINRDDLSRMGKENYLLLESPGAFPKFNDEGRLIIEWVFDRGGFYAPSYKIQHMLADHVAIWEGTDLRGDESLAHAGAEGFPGYARDRFSIGTSFDFVD